MKAYRNTQTISPELVCWTADNVPDYQAIQTDADFMQLSVPSGDFVHLRQVVDFLKQHQADPSDIIELLIQIHHNDDYDYAQNYDFFEEDSEAIDAMYLTFGDQVFDWLQAEGYQGYRPIDANPAYVMLFAKSEPAFRSIG